MLRAGDLGAYLYAKGIRVVAISRQSNGGLVGHGWFAYTGAIRVSPAVVGAILGNGSATLVDAAFQLVEPYDAVEWSAVCPFSRLPLGEFTEWQGIGSPDDFSSLTLCYLAEERASHTAAFAQIAAAVPQNVRQGEIGELLNTWAGMSSNDTRLDYSAAPCFGMGDIVVAESELTAGAVAPCSAVPGLPPVPPKQRVDGLDMIIWRVFQVDVELSPNAIWAILQQEIETGDPKFDLDLVLREIHGDTMGWTDSRGSEQTLGRRSFENRVRRLQKLARS